MRNNSPPDRYQVAISINRNIIDKNKGGQNKYFSKGWEPHELTLHEFAAAIDAGYSFGPQFEGGIRKGKNFVRCGFLAVDCDGTMSLQDALEHDFIKQHGGLLYTTPSHPKNGKDHFRIIFGLEAPLESGLNYTLALLGLAEMFGTDRAIAHAASSFFGSKGSGPTVLGNVLPKVELKALIKLGRAAKAKTLSARVSADEVSPDEVMVAGPERVLGELKKDTPIRLASGETTVIEDIAWKAAVYCPFHADTNPSAFIVRSKKKGDPGIHCSGCRKTWWIGGTRQTGYNFYLYDEKVQKLAVTLPNAKAMHDKSALVINEQYLPPLELRDGFVLVKSPKGSGKTTALKALVKAARQAGKSVLLIGHRQVLLRELATRLGLHCYLDDITIGGEQTVRAPDYYAVSVDSLPKRLKKPREYDVVIVDESEQVFSHITAKTIKNPHAVMTRLQTYIGDARSLYLLDADLNQVTLQFVAMARRKDPTQPVLLILNTHVAERRVCQLYADPTSLVVDLVKSARAGKRLFVACNSKRRAKLLAKLLQKDLGPTARILLVTADEKVSDVVQDFLEDIPKQILQYNAVVASPAISSGVDITFPDGAAMIDVVYGFFVARINPHYEIDQQLGRVRNPKEVKVWISGSQCSFEIAPDVVKLDLIQTGDTHPAVTGFKDGLPVVDMDHPLLVLQVSAYCAQRASQNRMSEYFIRHKERNGWQIVHVEGDKQEDEAMEARLGRFKAEVEQEYIGGVMAADTIDEYQWKELFDRKAAGETLPTSDFYRMVRFEIRNFYDDHLTPELIALDDHGDYRDCVKRYEDLHIHTADSFQLLEKRWSAYRAGTQTLAQAMGSRVLRTVELILLSCGLAAEGGIVEGKVLAKADLDGFLALCDERKVTIERDLNVNLRNDRQRDPVKTLNLCLAMIGLDMEDLGKTRKGGKSVYRYIMSPDRLKVLKDIVARRKAGKDQRSQWPEHLEPPRPRRKKPVAAAPNWLLGEAPG